MSEGMEVRSVTADEVLSLGHEVVFCDVREPEEFAQGHIPSALWIPLGELASRFAEIPRDQEVIMVCHSGRRSHRACEFLISQGYTQTINLLGGMLQWTGEVVVD